MECERCSKPATMSTMSHFNEDMICLDCEAEEKKHPDYQRACAAELAEVLRGNYNYFGVGWPGKDRRVGQ